MPPHGWIILNKPHGLGSTQAVSAVKRNLREAGIKVSGKGPGKTKVGHGGTLDPLATGILPIAIGEATKLTGRMLDASKIYEFTIRFGTQTSGLDAEGDIVASSDHRPSYKDVAGCLPEFTGAIEQIPPAFSALKINGKRAYELARAGEEVEMQPRPVTIYSLELKTNSSDDEFSDEPCEDITLTAHVSKGTYIRSLARDIALAVGSVGHVTMLHRIKAGPFTMENAISLDKVNKIGNGARLEDIILPLEAGLDDIPALDLSSDAAGALRQGRVLSGIATKDGLYWTRDAEQRPVALIEQSDDQVRVIRGFNM